jgi:threonine dehydrogenase-like Zn-dependent dehydrogenase
VVPGHEFVGVVAELDDEARRRWGVEVGDRVVSEQIVPCWQCRYCRRGQYWMCAVHDIYGFKRRTPGAMADYMVFPAEALVHRVSPDLPPAHAAFAEPLSCALHAVERAGIGFDDVVVVAGCGPIGLGMIAGAAAKSPAAVVALDMSDSKLELAREESAAVGTIALGVVCILLVAQIDPPSSTRRPAGSWPASRCGTPGATCSGPCTRGSRSGSGRSWSSSTTTSTRPSASSR